MLREQIEEQEARAAVRDMENILICRISMLWCRFGEGAQAGEPDDAFRLPTTGVLLRHLNPSFFQSSIELLNTSTIWQTRSNHPNM
jgi:hypothetical protein